MMTKIRIISKILLLAMIPITMLLFHNHLSNWHYHVLSNGIVVMHAHPYQKADNSDSPFSKHKHSTFEFFVFGQLSSLSALITFLFLALSLFPNLPRHLLYHGYQFPFLETRFLGLQSPRAPPTR